MKLTIKVKLLPNANQYQSLKKTMTTFNEACDYISKVAFENKKFSQVPLHHLVYRDVRDKFPLSSQLCVRAIDKVSQSYRIDKKVLHKFKRYSAVVYDQRLLSFKNLEVASMLSVDGRLKVPIVFWGPYASLDRNRMRGQADLTLEKGKFFLNVVIEMPDGTPFTPKGTLGVDKGIVSIAHTSDNETFSGKQVDAVRERTAKFRRELQKCGSKSAKRHLIKIAKKEARFRKHVNHCISKKIVAIAKDTERAIALEDLKGISFRTRFRKADRQRLGSWSFFQLDSFIGYKAIIAGVPVIMVDPRNTSRTCSVCGFVSKLNRKSQSMFSCVACGFTVNADLNASINIASKGSVNNPIAVHAPPAIAPSPGTANSADRIRSFERPAVSAAG